MSYSQNDGHGETAAAGGRPETRVPATAAANPGPRGQAGERPRGMAGLVAAGTVVVAGTAAAGAVPAIRHLLAGHLLLGQQIAGFSLVFAVAFAYVKVLRGAMGAMGRSRPSERVADLITLAVLMVAAAAVVGRPWMALTFIWPAAGLAGIRWPVSVLTGLAGLAGAAITGAALGQAGWTVAATVAGDALIACALAAACAWILRQSRRSPAPPGAPSRLRDDDI